MKLFTKVFQFLILLLIIENTIQAPLAGECASICSELKNEVLTEEICHDADQQPSRKVGYYCNQASEKAYIQACQALCQNNDPIQSIASACRAAASELPRPTVRRWCEHGYSTSFSKTLKDLRSMFSNDNVNDNNYNGSGNGGGSADDVDEFSVYQRISFQYDNEQIKLELKNSMGTEDTVVGFCSEASPDSISECITEILLQVL